MLLSHCMAMAQGLGYIDTTHSPDRYYSISGFLLDRCSRGDRFTPSAVLVEKH